MKVKASELPEEKRKKCLIGLEESLKVVEIKNEGLLPLRRFVLLDINNYSVGIFYEDELPSYALESDA